MSFISGVPSGTVFDYAGSSAPDGWLLCYGQLISTTTYADLFAALSYTYGGSGSSFRIPDLRGRAIAGKDDMGGSAASRITSGGSGITGTQLGAYGGAEIVSLTSAQSGFPGASGSFTSGSSNQSLNHSHSYSVVSGTVPVTGPGGGSPFNATTSNQTGGVDLTGHSHTTAVSFGAADASSAHTNTQPTIIFNKIIKI